jgi:molecular chaperone HtpG
MQTGKIGVTSENIFPIIKKFLYSDHEIFLRELVSNAVDASQKMKTIANVGDFKGELGELRVTVDVNKENKTITISDRGIGMTSEEVDKYINQIAFSSVNDFLDKYKDKADAIIGHFGLGFYSAFMVAEKVEILTKSYKEDAKAVRWECSGDPEYQLEETEKDDRGTTITLHLDSESVEFLEKSKIEELLNKYCKFLPVEIAFGKEQEWKEDKYVDTDKDKIVNNTKPAWTQKPADLKDEDYTNFYRELYPMSEDPLFNIHLNVDYPFNLTGILYFPRIKSNIEVQKNKIQLYSNQVYVTDSVEGIVPEFLTLLHGVIDSPDIPLNVSRSYLQSDSNVKKISSHITKKVADKLQEIFKNDRKQFEEKWDDLKLFVEYGMMTEDKFYEKAEKFALLKNTDDKYFTFEEYSELVKENQTDKNKQLIYLYTTNSDDQYSFIEAARNKGYDVLRMEGHLDAHFINNIENKLKDTRFVRVDADVVEKLIEKDTQLESKISGDDQETLKPVFKSQLSSEANYMVVFEPMAEKDNPVLITQSEFMRRMKDMAEVSGNQMGFYGDMPDSYNLVVNANHPLVNRINDEKNEKLASELGGINDKIAPIKKSKDELEAANKDKKDEEIPQADKDRIAELEAKVKELEDKKNDALASFGKENKLVKQLIDLALLSNNMLKGEELNKFIKRSIDLI